MARIGADKRTLIALGIHPRTFAKFAVYLCQRSLPNPWRRGLIFAVPSFTISKPRRTHHDPLPGLLF